MHFTFWTECLKYAWTFKGFLQKTLPVSRNVVFFLRNYDIKISQVNINWFCVYKKPNFLIISQGRPNHYFHDILAVLFPGPSFCPWHRELITPEN